MSRYLISKSFDFKVHADWIAHRKPVLPFYNEFSFIRELDSEKAILQYREKLIKSDEVWCSEKCAFFVNRLLWDSNYFGIDIFRIEGCLFGPVSPLAFLDEVNIFFEEFYFHHKSCRIVVELPSEDFEMIQAITYSALRLVESRLIHYKYPLLPDNEINYREAIPADAQNLGNVAAKMRNPADRLHADILFDNIKADEYIYTYARACVEGFTDTVIVPHGNGVSSNSFIAINYRKQDWKQLAWKPSQIVLAAVDAETNSGWYKKLIMASINHVAKQGANCIFNTTQITNKAVIHSLESLGFKLGASKLVFST